MLDVLNMFNVIMRRQIIFSLTKGILKITVSQANLVESFL